MCGLWIMVLLVASSTGGAAGYGLRQRGAGRHASVRDARVAKERSLMAQLPLPITNMWADYDRIVDNATNRTSYFSTIGIHYNKSLLGHPTELQLPAVNETVTNGFNVGRLLTTTMDFQVWCPVDGNVTEVNSELVMSPARMEFIGEEDVWLFKVGMAGPPNYPRIPIAPLVLRARSPVHSV
mmetsp:Transcript_71046/g.197352  ORF Transcript_71046/g.197352 Transcript_71046/m.197352 type:complete len:182 (+) Transcript_71046:72-617(+)